MNINHIRDDFPQLHTSINNKQLVYFDNAATTLKPKCFIEKINSYYRTRVANVHRGVHSLSEIGTKEFEETRIAIKELINAKHSHEIIFTKGTTESLNLLAQTFSEKHLQKGDEILISHMEHHSNIVPWQIVASKVGATLKIAPINEKGEIIFEDFKKLLSEKTKIVSITHISNTLGTINPIKEMIDEAHKVGAYFCIDAAQSVAHTSIDVQKLNCDFLVFSAHKMMGPNALGVIYGKESLLNDLPPYQGGGAMISEVTFEKTTFQNLPNKFEAGTPAIAEIISFKESINYLRQIGLDEIEKREAELLEYATKEILKLDGIKIIGTSKNKASVLSFHLEGCHPHDLGTLLDKMGIAIRTGHLCTQPLLKFYNLTSVSRASFSFYNTKEEIDIFIAGIIRAKEFLI